MAALVTLIVIVAVSGALFAGYIALCLSIRRIDKYTLRNEAPAGMRRHRVVMALTGMHAARWRHDGPTYA